MDKFELPNDFCGEYYLLANPDVATAILNGVFKSAADHWHKFGKAEMRTYSLPDNFDSEYYLSIYPDVAGAVFNGAFKSAADHWFQFGKKEGRTYSLTELPKDFDIFGRFTFRYPFRDYADFIDFEAAKNQVHPNDKEIIRRVVSAYKLMVKNQPTSELVDTTGMWHLAAQRSPQLIQAIKNSDYKLVEKLLSTMFQSHLTHGIAMGESTYVMSKHAPNIFAAQFGDRLLRLAESVGVLQIRSPEQGDYENLLDLNVDTVITGIEKKIGISLDFPQVGGLYGGVVRGKPFPELSLTHLYVAHRIRTYFEARGGHLPKRVFEIGGGFGSLAFFCSKLLPSEYTIYDLPLSCLIQSYFLLKSESGVPVILYGEEKFSGPSILISPWWEITTARDKEIDLVINQDSIPEMPENIGRFYIGEIGRQVSGVFYSINQEQGAVNAGAGQQTVVPELVEVDDRFKLKSRNLFWLRDGYVEEIYSVI
jgi:hypothetical protein